MMLHWKKIVALVFVVIFCIQLMPCYAMNTGVELTPITQEERTKIFASLEMQYHSTDPQIKGRFQRFDVNRYGEYALLFDNEGSREYIVVYSASGEFQFALSIHGGRSAPSFEWDDDNLILYRSGEAILVDRFGTLLEMYRYYDRETYLMTEVNNTVKETEEARYVAEYPLDFIIRYPFYLGTYTKLVKITADHERIVLYQASRVPMIIAVALGFGVIIAFACWLIRNERRRECYYAAQAEKNKERAQAENSSVP